MAEKWLNLYDESITDLVESGTLATKPPQTAVPQQQPMQQQQQQTEPEENKEEK